MPLGNQSHVRTDKMKLAEVRTAEQIYFARLDQFVDKDYPDWPFVAAAIKALLYRKNEPMSVKKLVEILEDIKWAEFKYVDSVF